MRFSRFLLFSVFLIVSTLSATEFTIATYNCGGLSDHYDYLRAAAMQKLMQERYNKEPQKMALNEKIQQVALKILFSSDPKAKEAAQQEWDQMGYQQILERLISAPSKKGSPNKFWNRRVDQIITSYLIRPVIIHDVEVNQFLDAHLKDLTRGSEAGRQECLKQARDEMARRIFAHQLKYDIICLQEADYLDESMFLGHYEYLAAATSHSKNGVVWNKERFELIETIGNIMGRAFAVHLRDKKSGKTVLIASGHISGCNPYQVETGPNGVDDSSKGDGEIRRVVELFDDHGADLKIIGMDSNVTSLHPRLHILKDAGYHIDYENFLEATCTNPNLVLNTRIDWIALKAETLNQATVTNIPVLNVGLNSIQTNISDHKPIAAKIKY